IDTERFILNFEQQRRASPDDVSYQEFYASLALKIKSQQTPNCKDTPKKK
ncbi:hypothetical protein BgiBS90_006771, partial [Biomphalaria glabrata]